MANLSALSGATSAISSLSNLILVTPQSVIGIKAQYAPSRTGKAYQNNATPFLFHYEGEQTLTLESDITDHFVEDNTAIVDHIALRPETITTHGYIGELNNVAPAVLAPLQAIANKLGVISGYTPNLSTTALIAYNEAAFLYQTAANAVNAISQTVGALSNLASGSGSLGGESAINGSGITISSNQNLQQTALQKFYGYWRARTLFTVQTPWAVFQDMAIKTLRVVQDESTQVISDFEITFKIMRFASTITEQSAGPVTLGDSSNYSGRAGNQASTNVNLGITTPEAASISSSQLYSGLA